MSLKARLISSVSMFVLVLALLVVSVFALRQERLSLGGTISFQASSVYAKVSATVSGMDENPTTLPTLIFSEGEGASSEEDIEKWNDLNLVFNSSATPIEISVTVENLSKELSLGVSITNQIASIENVNISITKGEEEATSATVAPTESATFVLTISLKDTSVSVPETSYDFLINLTEASQMREINVYSNVEGTNVSGSGLYAIGDTVTISAAIDESEVVLPLGIASDSNYENFVYKFGTEELFIEQNPSPYEFVLTEDSPTDYYCFYHDFASPTYKDTNTESPTYGFVFAYSGDFAIVVGGRSQGQKLEKVTHLDFPNTVTIEGKQYKVIGAAIAEGSPMAHYPNLESIRIPENFQLFVGVPINHNLTKLTEIKVSPENNSFSDMGMNVLYDKLSKTVVAACSTSEIPEEAKKIGYGAFVSCENLTSITIPEGITEIGGSAFYNCTSLTSVSLPKTLTSIGADAFYNCSSLTEITIPEGVTSIGERAFSGCTSLTSITLPSTLTSIDSYAFDSCYALAIVYNNSSLTIDGSSNCGHLGQYVKEIVNNGQQPQGSIEESGNVNYYINETTGKYIALAPSTSRDLVTQITIAAGAKEINRYAFSDCWALETVIFEENSQLTSIGEYAFENCSSLTEITIPESVTSIGDYAFYGCSSLTEITISEGVTSIGSSAFSCCYALAIVYNNSSLTIDGSFNCGYLGEYAKEVVTNGQAQGRIEESGNVNYYINETTGKYIALAPSTSRDLVTQITIAAGAKEINRYAFSDCWALETVIFEENSQLTSIGEYAFENCSSLTEITIPESVTSIGADAFYNCSGLTQITINGNISTLGIGAFQSCTDLTKLTLGAKVTSIPINLFTEGNLTELNEIVVKEGSKLDENIALPSYATWAKDGATVTSFKGAGTYTRTDIQQP